MIVVIMIMRRMGFVMIINIYSYYWVDGEFIYGNF